MISGGYSSVFVATPLMLWFTGGKMKLEPAAESAAGAQMRLEVPDEEDQSGVSQMVEQATEKKAKKKVVKKQRRR